LKVLITGASGRIGRALAKGIDARYGLRCADIDVADCGASGWMACDITDPRQAARAAAGMDAVVHLAGHPNSMDWDIMHSINVAGTLTMLRAAADAGVSRFLYASSVHVCGFHPADAMLTQDLPLWPDSPYGVSKAIGETHLRYFAEAYGMTGIAMRICSFRPEPSNSRELATWISEGDMVRLAEACLRADVTGFHAIWGVSANSRANLDDASWQRLGYTPRDNGSDHIARLAANGLDVTSYSEWPLLGGAFVDRARDHQLRTLAI